MLRSRCCGIALAAVLSILSFGRAHAIFDETEIEQGQSEIARWVAPANTPDIVSQSHLYCLALAVFFEGGSTAETVEGQEHIARVVAERARDGRSKWGGSDVCEVVFYKRGGVCQFTFACLPKARRTPRAGARWDEAVVIARRELIDGNQL